MPRPALPLAIVALALAAAAAQWRFVTTDMTTYLLPWFAHIRETGPVAAFAAPFANYAPPYLYLMALVSPLAGWFDPFDIVKALSLAGNAAFAASMWHLIRATPAAASRAPLAAALAFAMPSASVNAALLGQCDAMWAAACVMALAAALRRRHAAMLGWAGLAIGFKAQAAFFLPFVLVLLLRRRVPVRMWMAGPAAWASTLLPAWLAGWPLADLLTIYLRQTDTFAALSLNAPNIWMIVGQLPPLAALPLTGLALAAAVGASAAYVAWGSVAAWRDRALAEAALLAPLLVAGLLPRMHERFFFLADVLALAIAVAWPDRRSIGIAALVQAGSLLALLAYLSGVASLAVLGAAAMIAATVRLARPLLAPAANDNPRLPALRPA